MYWFALTLHKGESICRTASVDTWATSNEGTMYPEANVVCYSVEGSYCFRPLFQPICEIERFQKKGLNLRGF